MKSKDEEINELKEQCSGSTQCNPSDEAKELYKKFVDEIWKRQVSSSENFDKSILTYSSAGLAVSLAFLKDFVPIRSAEAPWLLFASWGLFAFATIITIISFLVSYKAQSAQMRIAERYFLEGDKSAYSEKSAFDIAITYCNYSSGGAFILALVSTTIFVSINLYGADHMTNKSRMTQDGLPSAMMQKVAETPLQKGIPSPALQKGPAPQQSSTIPNAPAQNGGQK